MNDLKAFLTAAAPALPTDTAELWGRTVTLKALDGRRVSRLFAETVDDQEARPAWLVALGVCGDDGEYLFCEKELLPELVTGIALRIGYPLVRAAAVVARLSKLDEDGDDAKKG